jgi:hypothetical protein
MNPLESSGKPLFFRVAAPGPSGVRPPENRRPIALRAVARSLSAMQKEALVWSSATGVGWRLASDEGAYLMGDDVAPCPLAFMTAGMVASFMEQVLALAAQRGIRFKGLRLTQDNYYTVEGSALRGTMIGGALPVDLTMEMDSAERPDLLRQLLEDAVALSPVAALLRNALPSRFTLTHNGRELRTGRVEPLGAAPTLE